jgi:hypothetical protein
VATASTTAPIPRFVAVTPPSDCAAVGDCNASYYPQLQVTATPLQATAVSGGKPVAAGNITIRDTRGGVLDWSASAHVFKRLGLGVVLRPFGIDNAL